jgi:hypothetical protein
MTTFEPSLFDRRPWQRVTDQDLAPAAAVPTMLSKRERKLYLWLAENWCEGAGAIVDLGCFAGGSTAYLAEGVRRSGRRQKIHAYDRMRADEKVKAQVLYPGGVPPFTGDNLEPVTRANLAPWADLVALHPGQIEDKTWDAGPIELLIVDAAKTAGVLDRIADTFYRNLIPGASLVVHQDVLHWKVPWIAYQMHSLAPWLRPVGHCAPDTIIFACTGPVNDRALAAGRLAGRSDADLHSALDSAFEDWGRWPIEGKLRMLKRALARNPMARRAKDFRRKPGK